MGQIKEPKNVDLIIKSEPCADKELEELKDIMRLQKLKRSNKKLRSSSKNKKHHTLAANRHYQTTYSLMSICSPLNCSSYNFLYLPFSFSNSW